METTKIFFLAIAGMEHKLGDEAHDDTVGRWKKRYLQDTLRRVQSCARVHRRLHFPLHEDQGRKSAARPAAFSQTNGRLAITKKCLEDFY